MRSLKEQIRNKANKPNRETVLKGIDRLLTTLSIKQFLPDNLLTARFIHDIPPQLEELRTNGATALYYDLPEAEAPA